MAPTYNPMGSKAPGALMRRHPALQDLSRDHFTASVACLHMRRAAASHPQAPPLQEVMRGLMDLWHRALHWHFDEEDEDLTPHLEGTGQELLDRLRADHARLRAAFEDLERRPPDAFAAVAEDLQKHIRWEEDVLFPWLQAHLSDHQLEELWQKSRSFRIEHRGPASVQQPSLPKQP